MRNIEDLGDVEMPSQWERCIISGVQDPLRARDIFRFHLNGMCGTEPTLPFPLQVVFSGGTIVIHNRTGNGITNLPLSKCLWHLCWGQTEMEVIFE